MNLYTAAITLILVMDPLGNVPVFLSLLKGIDQSRYTRIIFRESLIAFVILALFLFFGHYVLRGLQISTPALGIAGGIILFIIALRMIFPAQENDEKKLKAEPFIVPLAVPLIAGPSSLATVLLLASNQPNRLFEWFLALVVATIIFMVIVLSSKFFMRVFRQSGLTAMERLMGMILTTVAVQMFLTGVSDYFHLN